MKTSSVLFALATVLIFSLAAEADHAPSSTTIYVDASSVGALDGSEGAPFDTIQEAVDHARPGDTILVASGTYEETVSITTDHITLTAEAGAIMDGSNVDGSIRPKTGNAFYLTGVRGVTVRGFDIRHYNAGGLHYGRVGFYLQAATDSVIRDNIISDVVQGIVLWYVNSGDTIDGNQISASNIGTALYYGCDHNVVKNNVISGTFGKGVTLASHSRHGFPSDNIIEGNVITSKAGYGLHVQGAEANGNVFRSNRVSGVFSDGIALWASNNVVERNVITGGQKGIYISAHDTVVKWNKIDGSGTQGIYLQGSGNVVKYNTISPGRITGLFVYYDNDNNVFKWNTITGSTSTGILLQGRPPGANGLERVPNDNLVAWNKVLDGRRYGIRLLAGATRNIIKENTVTGSGILDLTHDAESSSNTWTENTCDSSSGFDVPACD